MYSKSHFPKCGLRCNTVFILVLPRGVNGITRTSLSSLSSTYASLVMSTSRSACNECQITVEQLRWGLSRPAWGKVYTQHFSHKLASKLEALDTVERDIFGPLCRSAESGIDADLTASYLKLFVDDPEGPSRRGKYITSFARQPTYVEYLTKEVKKDPWHFTGSLFSQLWDDHPEWKTDKKEPSASELDTSQTSTV